MTSQTQTQTSDPIHDTSELMPIAPSYIDRLMNFVEHLPIPYWVTYLMFFIFHSIALQSLAWVDGGRSAYSFSSLLIIYPLWLWGPLAIMTFLDSISLDALSSFAPLLDLNRESMRQLRDEFTNMPSRNVIVNGVTWLILYLVFNLVAFDAAIGAFGPGVVTTVTIIILGLPSFFAGNALYYHSYRQLKLVNRTVKMVEQFNLFRLDPVYALSRLTAQTGVAWVIMLSLTLLLVPIQLSPAVLLTMLIAQGIMAISAFVLPLWIVHQRLISDRRTLLAELDQRVESTLQQLHHHFDKGELNEIDHLNSALSGFRSEREILTNTPTWPWRKGTFTGFLSAIFLPIFLFIIQLFIGSLIGE